MAVGDGDGMAGTTRIVGNGNAHATATPSPDFAAFSTILGVNFTPPDGQTLIKVFESCRLESYQDSRGRWTIGWGHTGPEVVAGMVWTQDQADAQFQLDFASRTQQLAGLALTMTAGQTAACESLIYNVGFFAFSTSHLLACIKAGDWIGAAHEFPRWDHADGPEDKGLLHRRLAEALVFIASSR